MKIDPPYPWDVYADVSRRAEFPNLNDRTWGADAALHTILDHIETRAIPPNRKTFTNQVENLIGNRTATFRNRRRLLTEHYVPFALQATTPDPATSALARRELLHIQDRVTPQERSILEDAARGFEYSEIAQRHNLTLSNVKSKIARARARLRPSPYSP